MSASSSSKLRRRSFLQCAAALAVAGASSRALARPPVEIVMYGTRWCPACNDARTYFQQRHIPFVDVDIEHDVQGRAEMRRLAQLSGINPRLVPLVKIGENVLSGFDASRVAGLLRHFGY